MTVFTTTINNQRSREEPNYNVKLSIVNSPSIFSITNIQFSIIFFWSIKQFVQDDTLYDLLNEGQGWTGLCLMPGANKSILAQPFLEGYCNEYWVIKKVGTFKHSQVHIN